MKYLTIFLVLIHSFVNGSIREDKLHYVECIIEMPEDLPSLSAVLTINRGKKLELFKPSGKITKLSKGSKLSLFCTGKRNFLRNFNESSLELTCKSGKNYQTNDGKIVLLKNLECDKEPKSEIQITKQKCSNNHGIICNSGFRINSNVFLTVFSICFDFQKQHAIYSKNIINGAAIKYKIKGNRRRSFKSNIMEHSTAKLHNIYSKKDQIKHFNSFFGMNQQIINNTMFFARGHLAPDADFIISYEQHSTYFYENVAPTYQIINSGNWVRCENFARILAADYNCDLEIYTGFLDNLKFNKSISMYLDNEQQMIIPLWYFKIIKNPKLNSAVVLITLNNPFAHQNDIYEFCPNVCNFVAYDLQFIFKDIPRGYTFCCELNEFKNAISNKYLNEITANELLTEKYENRISLSKLDKII